MHALGDVIMILVFGSNGQVGLELAKFDGVLTLDRAEADLTNPEACAHKILQHKPMLVINAAAYTAVDKAETEKELATLINADAPAAMAKACSALDIPFVHISTDYVFDGSGETPRKPNDATNPVNVYGYSKRLGEEAIVRSGAIYAILRTSWVVSAHRANFVKSMLNVTENHKLLRVVDDQIGGPTPAHSVAKACVQIAHSLLINPEKKGVYHFSGKPDVSWYEFAKTIFECAGRDVQVNAITTSGYPTPAQRPQNSRLNCDLTKSVFDIDRPNWGNGLTKILKDLGEIQ